MTFGMLDPKDESFLRNAKTPSRLRNGENTRTRRKSINSKKSNFFENSKLNKSNANKNKNMNVSLVSRSKKSPQQDTSMFPPLTSLPSSKSADQLETIKTPCCRGNRTRRSSGLTDFKNFSHNQSKSSKYSNNLMKNFKNVSTIS